MNFPILADCDKPPDPVKLNFIILFIIAVALYFYAKR